MLIRLFTFTTQSCSYSRTAAQVQDNCQNSVQQGCQSVRYYHTQTACTPLLFPQRPCRDWYNCSQSRVYTAWPMNDLPHNICVKNLSQKSCHLFSVLTFLSFPFIYVSYSSVRSSAVIGDRCIHSCAYHHCRQYSCCCSFNAVLHNISPFIFIHKPRYIPFSYRVFVKQKVHKRGSKKCIAKSAQD